jgi:hypothetical protein
MGFFDRFKIKDEDNFVSKKREKINTGSASSVFGSAQSTYTTTYEFSPIDSRTFNINSAGASGSLVTTKKETTLTPSTSLEKPLSISPALFGGGSTTATGNASAESGLNLSSILGIAVLGGVALIVLPKLFKKRGKKKK